MLELLFTSKNRIKIIQFILFETKETYLREISRKLKISPSAVKKEIENLEKLNIIKKEKNIIKANNSCNFIESLKDIFIKTDFIYYPLKKALENNKRIEYALIFGSFAREDYTEDSDVDLLVISSLKIESVIKKLEPIEKKIKRDINPVVWTLSNLKKEKDSSFVKDLVKKGIIMIKGDEAEFKKIIS